MTNRILIVDDHPLIVMGLKVALVARGCQVETTSGPTAAAVIALAHSFQPDCVVLDVHLGDQVGSGVDLIGPLCEIGAAVVMLTGETDRFLLASCLEAGAQGWIGKGSGLDEVVEAIADVGAGRSLFGCAAQETMLDELRAHRASRGRALARFELLTSCEQRVLGALIEGSSAEQIAEAHFVALATIRSHIRAVLHKLGVRSQLAAVAKARRAGWQPPASRASARRRSETPAS
jgi:DNA-binding NarL/FixJ family response regulator